MGLSESRKARRVERKAEAKIRKAEAKAIKTRVKLEAKVGAHEETERHRKALRAEHKYHRKAQKAERKTAKVTSKAQQKASAAETKSVVEQAKATAPQGLLTPTKVKRYLAVAKLAAPVAGPLLYRAAIAARSEVTNLQARRAGVPAGLLSQYGGPSAPLRARIAAASESAVKVEGRESSAEGVAFVGTMRDRLDNLVVALDATDTMPPAQRRAAQRAVANELNAIDNDLLARLNVHP